ncbi:hypothetical protein F0U44_05495 [Nocardioides humilatus]|uniref:Uncharacterized protein n=1 Tax=Nocardioides humilatus TaxID=2607660 RepID=A0A5B1LQ47_9ACTN|nr:hypothetical protein [Nocardioides humilatus]KAA1421727.1 hypothetical protein F0U44_05495 [Nocardioides humilatus]
MGDWIPLLVRREDYPELAALVAQREIGRPDRALGSVVSTDLPTSSAAAPAPTYAAPVVAEPVVELTPTEQAEVDALARFHTWSEADLLRLATSPVLAAHRWRMAFDACAAQPGRFFPDDRVAPLTGVRPEEWLEVRTAMGRFLETHFPDVPGAPMVVIDGLALERDAQDWWAVPEEQARRWREIRGSLPQPRRPKAPLPVPSVLD